MASKKPLVFLDISIDGEATGQIQIELFDKEVPKTAETFRAHCKGEGVSKSGKPLHYKGSPFHRAIPGVMCCGGDFINGDGTGTYQDKFPVERHPNVKSPMEGLLFTGHGVPEAEVPYKCGPAFMITTAATPWLLHTHTIFGKVVRGMDVVKAIEKEGSTSGTIKKKVEISDCGEVPPPPPRPARAFMPGSLDSIYRVAS